MVAITIANRVLFIMGFLLSRPGNFGVSQCGRDTGGIEHDPCHPFRDEHALYRIPVISICYGVRMRCRPTDGYPAVSCIETVLIYRFDEL